MQILLDIPTSLVAGVTSALEAYNRQHQATIKNEAGVDIPNPALLATESDYITFVMTKAIESWNKQYGFTVSDVVTSTPRSISKRQGRLQLKNENLLTIVENYMNSLPVDDTTRMAYNDASEWVRTDPNIIAMLTILGKSSEDADAFFLAASVL